MGLVNLGMSSDRIKDFQFPSTESTPCFSKFNDQGIEVKIGPFQHVFLNDNLEIMGFSLYMISYFLQDSNAYNSYMVLFSWRPFYLVTVWPGGHRLSWRLFLRTCSGPRFSISALDFLLFCRSQLFKFPFSKKIILPLGWMGDRPEEVSL